MFSSECQMRSISCSKHVLAFICSVCLPGSYGSACQQRCSCPRGASCHHVSGECACPPGFTGSGCEQSERRRNSLLSGFRLGPAPIKRLLLPLSACLPGTFGHNCNQVCQCSAANQHCHPASGQCYCAPGFHGPRCDRSRSDVSLVC